jgi:hypothetical protein
MQGIQLISGTDDAWGGFSARYLDRIRDEYGKTPVLFWGLEDSVKSIPRVRSPLPLRHIPHLTTPRKNDSRASPTHPAPSPR